MRKMFQQRKILQLKATPSNNESAPQSTDASNKDVVNQAVNTSAPRMRAFSLAAVAADAPAAGTDITKSVDECDSWY